jgi:hypothetical protein
MRGMVREVRGSRRWKKKTRVKGGGGVHERRVCVYVCVQPSASTRLQSCGTKSSTPARNIHNEATPARNIVLNLGGGTTGHKPHGGVAAELPPGDGHRGAPNNRPSQGADAQNGWRADEDYIVVVHGREGCRGHVPGFNSNGT